MEADGVEDEDMGKLSFLHLGGERLQTEVWEIEEMDLRTLPIMAEREPPLTK